MYWALDHNDPNGWLSCDMEAAKALIATNDGPFKQNLDRYKYASRYNDNAKRGDLDLSHRQAAEVHLGVLEGHLGQTANLLGEVVSIADIAIFPFIRQFANADKRWWDTSPYEALQEWLSKHIESELFKTIMIKHPVWKT